MENLTNGIVLNAGTGQLVITVTLRMNSEGNEILHFEGAPEELDIDFVNSDQTSLRKLFRWLLDEQLKQRFSLKLEIDSSVKNVTYKKVAEDYVSDLNTEIDQVFSREMQTIGDLQEQLG